MDIPAAMDRPAAPAAPGASAAALVPRDTVSLAPVDEASLSVVIQDWNAEHSHRLRFASYYNALAILVSAFGLSSPSLLLATMIFTLGVGSAASVLTVLLTGRRRALRRHLREAGVPAEECDGLASAIIEARPELRRRARGRVGTRDSTEVARIWARLALRARE
jgi:hypothetical protein